MKIKKIKYKPFLLNLVEPYTIAYETFSATTNVFMMAETDTGIRGFGCAAPDKSVTGETAEDTIQAIYNYIEPLLANSDPFHYIQILEDLKSLIPQNPSALAMTDMLLFDLVSKSAGVPLFKYLGGYRDAIPTSITIGILPLDQTLRKAKEYFRQGFRIFKLKGGVSCDEDIEKVIKIRETFAYSINLRIDANQGYSFEDAVRFVEETRNYSVELLEQPTPRENLEMLGRVSSNVHIPVMADESIMSLKDVFNLTRNDLTDMINIKLMKAGGISEAMHINSVARAAKVEAMVGCMDESELAIAAGLHFALSRPNIVYADLDGHLDLLNDPFKNTITLRDGILYPSSQPGLGVQENSAILDFFTS